MFKKTFSKNDKKEYALKMVELDAFCKENNIIKALNGKSFYFEINNIKYRISSHTIEASNAKAFNEFGEQIRELYHPNGRNMEQQIFASPLRVKEIYLALKAGKILDGKGKIIKNTKARKPSQMPTKTIIKNRANELIH